jgi:hypothetical protein
VSIVTRVLVGSSVALLAGGLACKRAPVPTLEVIGIPVQKVPTDPGDSMWERAPEHVARLLVQDVVEPRLMKPTTSEVRVRVLTGPGEIAFRLEWEDPVRDDAMDAGRFVDACAVQLPRKLEAEPPNPQMGEAGRPVEITFWRADWQAWVEGRRDDIRSFYPNAAVDHYPFAAPSLNPGSAEQVEMARLYAPAEAAGNRRSGPREQPVEDLVAEGPGTLAPAGKTVSRGKGRRSARGWRVVLTRPLPAGLAPRARTQVAFAVWEGSHAEVGARKMRTGWIPLLLKETP